jgi:outer membrane protein OmpA-like peptidoglycan-associated protein/ABC-type nitrate/sulfonate/bicarbonate transport system substrate-binding protein
MSGAQGNSLASLGKFFAFLILGALVLIGFWLKQIYDSEKSVFSTSDAKDIKGTILLGSDSWIGYFPMCSEEMRSRIRAAGYVLKCIDDNANYAERIQKIASGELQFAFATVDSYLLAGAANRYPGVVVSVIDQSHGGDALVAWKDSIKSLDHLKQKGDVKIAFTPNSPSHHLLKGIALHFDIPLLRRQVDSWRIETNGSSEALQKFTDRTVDAAVLWEPDVSKALQQPGAIKLLSSKDTEKLIVDILLVNREVATKQPELVLLLLNQYFRTLKYFRSNPDKLTEEIIRSLKIDTSAAQAMVQGVSWVSLADNANHWFGISLQGQPSREDLIKTIETTNRILMDSGDFQNSPIPNEDPYRLQNKSFIEKLYLEGLRDEKSDQDNSRTLDRDFSALAEDQWKKLVEVGTLKVLPITFLSGISTLDIEGKMQLDKAAENLSHYPNFRVIIKGHTGNRGDENANLLLSQERAESVKRYLMVTYNIDSDRLYAHGVGAAVPLPRLAGESDRAFNYRLPRVELYLVSDDL